jgi:Uncharacterized protein conserved in bacteria (DUF2252)
VRAQPARKTPALGLAAFAFVLAATGCKTTAAQLGPREELRQALMARYEHQLKQDPDAVAEKWRRMAKGNFAFFRGAIGLYPAEPSQFIGPAIAEVAVVGDPHPENLGTFPQASGEVIVDYNDFDQAGFGSFVSDLRRLALGLYITGDAADVPKRQRARLVDSAVLGYVAELGGLARGEAPVHLRADSAFSGGLADILEPGNSGIGDDASTLSPEERAGIEAALKKARPNLLDPARFPEGFFAVKRAVRTRGGIASLFLQRVRIAVEGPSASPEDDVLVELKETAPGAAERLVRLQRELQERPDQDPLLGWTELGQTSFRLRSFGLGWRSVSVDRLASAVKGPGWGKKDLRAFAYELGRLLARGHARAAGRDGKPGRAALEKAIGDGKELAAETVAVTAKAAARLEGDVDNLRALLAERGALLGWQRP